MNKENKIYYNIDDSNYVFRTENFKFYFSSRFYLERFVKSYLKNRELETYKLTSRHNILIDCVDYFDIILYSNIEKRGFKIKSQKSMITNGQEVVFSCLQNIVLNGEIKILRN